MERSNDSKLSEKDMRIVKAIEADGQYKLWGWEVPDYCTLDLIFDDLKTPDSSCRVGFTITFYPVNKENEDAKS